MLGGDSLGCQRVFSLSGDGLVVLVNPFPRSREPREALGTAFEYYSTICSARVKGGFALAWMIPPWPSWPMTWPSRANSGMNNPFQ